MSAAAITKKTGIALRVAGGDETDVEPLITLLHDALGPRQ
jgi:hypothetical protein